MDRSRHARVIAIRPSTGLAGLGLREAVEARELLFFFIWRDLKVRYRQTLFGAAWALLQPLLLMAVFTLVLGRVAGSPVAGVPYPIFALVALVPWTFFSQGLGAASASLVGASNLIQKAPFPRLLLPAAAVGSFLVDYLIGLAFLFVALIVSSVTILPQVIAIAPLTVLLIEVAFGLGLLTAAVSVRYRDVRYAVPFLIQVMLFLSPVAYDSSVVPEPWRSVYVLNPLVGVIDGFRWAILGGAQPPVLSVATSFVVSTVILVLGLAYFRVTERTFADVI